MIKILIADDEAHARDRLKELIGKYEFMDIQFEAKNGDEVIQLLISNKIDVAFLDINMPGVSVFNSISSLKNPPLIIFQTAYSEFAVDAFRINVLDYLLKPVSEERLKSAVDKIVERLKIKNDTDRRPEKKSSVTSISVKSGSVIKILPVEEIYHITFEEGFCFIYTEKERFLADKFLNFYEEELKDSNFFRTNRKDLINLKFINTIHPMFNGNFIIEMKNKAQIALSRRRTKELKDIIKF
jgi:DNA-binding LytR/AlgR family response regulator